MTQGWDDIKHLPEAWCEDSNWDRRPCLACPGCAAFVAERAREANEPADAIAIYRGLTP